MQERGNRGSLVAGRPKRLLVALEGSHTRVAAAAVAAALLGRRARRRCGRRTLIEGDAGGAGCRRCRLPDAGMQSRGGGGGVVERPGGPGGEAAGGGDEGGAWSGGGMDRTRWRMLRSDWAACTCACFAIKSSRKLSVEKYLLLGRSSRSGYWSGSEEW